MRPLLAAVLSTGVGLCAWVAGTEAFAAADSWKRAVPYAQASRETTTAAKAVINGAGSEECLRGKLSNALIRLSNSCDVNGHATDACELANRLSSRESALSVVEMVSTSESLLEMLGDNGPQP